MRVDHQSSFIHFVYPFLFDSGSFAPCAMELESVRWEGRNGPFEVWCQQEFPDEELLSDVARFLNPSPAGPSDVRLLRLTDQALRSTRGLGCGVGANVNWDLVTPHGEIPFDVSFVQLALFRVGVGLLTIGAEPSDRSGQIGDWLDFMHYFRFGRGQRDVGLRARRKVGFDRVTRQARVVPFFPDPAGGLEQGPEGRGLLTDLLNALLRTAGPRHGGEPWWREVFVPGQLLPFASVYVNEIADDEIPRLVYRMRNFFRSEQKIHPADDDLRLDHEQLLQYAKGQWFFFSLDGGGFVACNPPATDFFRHTLSNHLRDHYFLLFLLALQQRFALMMLEETVAAQWFLEDCQTQRDESLANREQAFTRISNRFLSFTARGHFAQVMQREHHHRCYRKWQDVFQIGELYSQVRDEIQYMHGYLQTQREQRAQRLEEERRRQTERFERRLNQIAWLIGIPALALTFLGTIGPVDLPVALYTVLGSLSIGLVAYLVVRWLAGRASDRRS